MRHIYLSLCFYLLVGPFASSAQTTADVAYSVTYTQHIRTFCEFSAATAAAVSPLEAVGMKPRQETRRVTMVMDRNRDLCTTLEILENDAEPWMTAPRKITMNKTGVTLFNEKNQVISTEVFNAEQTQAYQAIQQHASAFDWNGTPGFQPAGAPDFTDLKQKGFTVSAPVNGVIQLRKGSQEYEIDYNNLTTTITQYEQTQPSIQIRTAYRRQGAQIIPLVKTEKQFRVTNSGACYALVTESTISNYSRIGLP